MMKTLPLPILLIWIFALSCKKDNSSQSPSGPLLTKYVEIHEQDSVVYDFEYDQNHRIVKFTFSGTGFGPGLNVSTTQLVRNNAGIITKLIDGFPSPNPQLNPNDTAIVFYDNNKSHYTLLLTHHKINSYGQPADQRDSVLLVYDNSGKITQRQLYFFDVSVGSDYTLSGVHFYKYDQLANLTTDSVVAYGNGYNATQQVIRYQYDTHPNPLSLGNEALLLRDRDWIGLPRISGWFSKNNVVNGTYIEVQSPISNFNVTRVFNYSSQGLPIGSMDQWQNTANAPLTAGGSRYYY